MKRCLAIVLASVMAASLTACGGSSGSSSSSSSSATAETTKAEVSIKDVDKDAESTQAEERVIDDTKRKEIVVATDVEPDAMFPWNPDLGEGNDDNPILVNLYESAYQVTYDGDYTPVLADSYEVNDDGTEWTIHFKDGVYFSNGYPMTMEDVVWSYDGQANHKSNKTLWENYDHTEIIDDHTVKVVCSEPKVQLFRGAIGNRAGVILSKKYYDEVGMEGYIEKPIGTGPYLLTTIKSHEYMVFEKNPNYWDKDAVEPFYEKITLKYLTDQNTQSLALENGEIDVLLNAKLPPLLRLPENSGISFDATRASGPITMQFNEVNGPTADINIRKAIAACVDRDAINQVVFDGYSTPSRIKALPYFAGYPDEADITVWPEEYSPEKAKEYLAAAGYNGETIILATQNGSMMDTVAQIIQGELMNIGVDCEVKSVDRASLMAMIKSADGWHVNFNNAASAPMDMILARSSYRESERKGTNPILILNNEEMEDCWDTAENTMDEATRKKAYARGISLINEECRYVPIIDNLAITAFRDDIKGVRGCPITYMTYFKDWY